MLQIKLIEVAERRMRKVSAYGVTLKVPYDAEFLAMDKDGTIAAYKGEIYASEDAECWLFKEPYSEDYNDVNYILEVDTDYTVITPCDWRDTKVAI